MSIIRMTKSRLVRCTAILFLLYTGVDIACPQICSEEVVSFAANEAPLPESISTGKTTVSVRASSDKEDSQRNEPTDQKSQDEDCFCCCAHVVPGMVYVAPTLLDLKSPVSVPDLASVPTPPLFQTFHPPRFA
jgi:hypothetical protein